MHFHIMVSIGCNSQCRYCYKKGMEDEGDDLNEKFNWDFEIPKTIEYKTDDLKKFIEKDEGKHTITFYGGEALLQIEKIKEIMDKLKNVKFMIQTNGLLLDKLDKRYTNKFDKILISVDGIRELTDFNRGEDTYEKVLSNIKSIKENGFSGEIVARMVVDEYTIKFGGLLKQIKSLIKEGFDAVHWQLDAGFYKSDYTKRNFSKFIDDYNKNVKESLDYWTSEMQKGKMLKLYPFLGIFEILYYNKKTKLQCGSGHANYTISTNGKISVCPIMHDAQNYQIGDIWNSSPDKLKEVNISGFCEGCDIRDICGGRCLYANKAELWPKKGQEEICESIRFLIENVSNDIDKIKKLIKEGKVSEGDFEYEKFSGPEIIP